MFSLRRGSTVRRFGSSAASVAVAVALLLSSQFSVAASASAVLTNCTPAALANALQQGGTVTFMCDGTLTLTNTIVISTNTTLDAGGRNVILSGNDAVRLFEVRPNVLFTIEGVTLRNGRDGATNAPARRTARGGAIFNQGRLILANCQVSNCSAVGGAGRDGQDQAPVDGENGEAGGDAFGGALYNDGGLVILTNTVFFGNNTAGGTGGNGGAGGVFGHGGHGGDGGRGGSGGGGAIFNARGTMEIIDCTFASNHVAGAIGGDSGVGAGVLGFNGVPGGGGPGLGGAIFNKSGAVHITNSSFEVNTCVGVAGFDGRPGRSNMDGEDGIDGSGGRGGGIFNENGTIQGTNVTFLGNVLVGGDGGAGGAGGELGFGGDGGDGGDGGAVLGGGIYNKGGTVKVSGGTFSGSLLVPGNGGTGGAGGGLTGRDGSSGMRGRAEGAEIFSESGTVELNGESPGMLLNARFDSEAGQLFLSWPATDQVTLESTSSLGSQWAPVAASPARVGTLNTLSVPVSGQGAFFRLRRQ